MDNDVPRSVTRLLRNAGEDVIEVRDVLGGDAPDTAVHVFAASEARWLVTRDRVFAEDRRSKGSPTLWLQARQTEEAERLQGCLPDVIESARSNARQMIVHRGGELEVER